MTVSDKGALKAEYERRTQEAPWKQYSTPTSDAGPAPGQSGARAIVSHLALDSPTRYAAIYTVLAEAKKRLAGEVAADATHAWTPERLIEWDCRAAEGLWAFNSLYEDVGADGGALEYQGSDADYTLLHVAADLAAQKASSTTQPWSSDVQQQEGGVLQAELSEKLQATFSPKPLRRVDDDDAAPPRRTMLLSAFRLSALPTDADRQQYIKRMWKQRDAEVLVLIDDATPRGFASIASARAQMLQLGAAELDRPEETGEQVRIAEGGQVMRFGRQVFYEQESADAEPSEALQGEEEVEDAPPRRGAHVVAPCPHDRPCPLLNPFASFLPGDASGRANAFTRGRPVCGFPQTVHLPRYTRNAKKRGGAAQDDLSSYSYVIIRRGPRPSIEAALASEEQELVDVAEAELGLRMAAAKTKVGDIEKIRRGDSAGGPSPAQILPADEDAALDGAVGEDAEAQDMLKSMMPEILQRMREEASDDDQISEEQIKDALASLSLDQPESLASTSFKGSVTMLEDGAALGEDDAEVDEADLAAMRLESYSWPRLVKAPIKKGGHVTLDACCPTGAIERFTIAKSAGKQAYQDARKALWGDLFPHSSKTGKSTIQVPSAAVEDDFSAGTGAPQFTFTKGQRNVEDTTVDAFVVNDADGVEEGNEEVLKELYQSDEDLLKEMQAAESSNVTIDDEPATQPELPNALKQIAMSPDAAFSLIGPDALSIARGEKNANRFNLKARSRRAGKRTHVEYSSGPNYADGSGGPSRRLSRKRSMSDYLK